MKTTYNLIFVYLVSSMTSIQERLSSVQIWYHVRAVVIALFFASLTFYLINQYDLLTADIQWGPVAYGESDVVAYFANESIYIEAWRNIEDLESISLLIFYDTETLTLSSSSFTSEYDISSAEAGDGMMQVIVSNVWVVDMADELVRIVGEWAIQDMSLGDIVWTFWDGSSQNMSLQVPK